jgi:vacuolar iron transporter family protein
LSEDPQAEREELAEIYVMRGVDRTTAQQVARQLMAKDPLTAHARDELGISEITTARPVQAALTSAVMFSVGAAMPLLMVVVSPANVLVPIVSAASLGFLALLGAIGAKARGASMLRATIRVTFWGSPGARYHRRNRQAFWNDSLKSGSSSVATSRPDRSSRFDDHVLNPRATKVL